MFITLKLDSIPPVKGDSSKSIANKVIHVGSPDYELEQIDYDNMHNPQFTVAYIKEIFVHLRATEVFHI